MRYRMKKILQCLCVILILTNMIVYADETDVTSISDLIEYDVIYELETAETTTTLNATFTLTNNENVAKNPLLLVAAYYNGRMIDMQTAQKNITAGTTVNETLSVVIPNNKKEKCYIKLFAWEGTGSLRPLGKYKKVTDFEPYLREKLIYVTSVANAEFKIYMNASLVKGANVDAVHSIEYDASKVSPIDLCGFTHEREVSAMPISNAGITIESVDTTNGIIRYKFLQNAGRNTGINNVVIFKTLTSITESEIKYTIQ